jgi:hypothetical protein
MPTAPIDTREETLARPATVADRTTRMPAGGLTGESMPDRAEVNSAIVRFCTRVVPLRTVNERLNRDAMPDGQWCWSEPQEAARSPPRFQNVSGLSQGPRLRTCGRLSRAGDPPAEAVGPGSHCWWRPGGEEAPNVRHETARAHHPSRRRGSRMATRGARAAAGADAADWRSGPRPIRNQYSDQRRQVYPKDLDSAPVAG